MILSSCRAAAPLAFVKLHRAESQTIFRRAQRRCLVYHDTEKTSSSAPSPERQIDAMDGNSPALPNHSGKRESPCDCIARFHAQDLGKIFFARSANAKEEEPLSIH